MSGKNKTKKKIRTATEETTVLGKKVKGKYSPSPISGGCHVGGKNSGRIYWN